MRIFLPKHLNKKSIPMFGMLLNIFKYKFIYLLPAVA